MDTNMKSLLILLLVLAPSTAMARHRCFCRPASATPVQKVTILPVKTIIKQVRLEPSIQPVFDPEGIIAKAKALEIAFQSVIDQDLAEPQWLTNKFTNRMGQYIPSELLQRQAAKAVVVRRNAVGIVNTSFRILPNGYIDFNVTNEQQPAQYNQNYGY
jgi:hypothetical protein